MDTLLYNIISAESLVKLSYLQRDLLTEEEWNRISNALSHINFDCIKFIPFSTQLHLKEQILNVIEKSNSNIVIIDDFSALGFRDNQSVEEYLYCLKGIASQTGTVVIILDAIPNNHNGLHRSPKQQDIQFEALYRLCDVVQYVYQEENDYFDDTIPKQVEIIIAKNQCTSTTGVAELAVVPEIPAFRTIEDSVE